MGEDVAVITGGGGGIGAATAVRLAERGVAVGVFDLDIDACARVAAAIRDTGGLACAGRLDTADTASVEGALDLVEAELGATTLAVTAAGIIAKQPFLELSLEDWERTLAVNLTGTWLVMQRTAARMVAGGRSGAFVALSSVAGRGGRHNAVDYAASKAGVISVVRSAALALASHGIRVNAVCPGIVATPMTDAIHDRTAAELGITPEESIRRMLADVPLGRLETPEEVASAIDFLLSDNAAYITGQALNVCGGLEMD